MEYGAEDTGRIDTICSHSVRDANFISPPWVPPNSRNSLSFARTPTASGLLQHRHQEGMKKERKKKNEEERKRELSLGKGTIMEARKDTWSHR